jgi:hypothetical protein
MSFSVFDRMIGLESSSGLRIEKTHLLDMRRAHEIRVEPRQDPLAQ